jgi:hypothetical protein
MGSKLFYNMTGNKDGSYLTMFSRDGLQFGILSIIASFGNVWADQSYWQVRNQERKRLK